MTYRVRILRRAERDLAELHAYLSHDTPEAPVPAVEHIFAAIDRLADHPERGVRPRDPYLRGRGYRFLVVASWLIFYKVGRRTVRVYRVVHAKRNYRDLL